jgi:hypothetical protein
MVKSRKRHKSRRHSFKFEIFFLKYGLPITGILLIAAGLVYLFLSGIKIQFLADAWKSFISQYNTEDSPLPQNTEYTLRGYLLLLYFGFGTVIIIVPQLIRRIPEGLKNVFLVLGYVLLVFGEVKIYLDTMSFVISLNYYLILLSFVITQLILSAIAMVGKNRFALNMAILYFFVSILFIRLTYSIMFPNIILLICFQTAVSVYCYKFSQRLTFVLLVTLSFAFLSYYFLKLVLFAIPLNPSYTYMLPGLLLWFILSIAGFGMLKTGSYSKFKAFIWDTLPYLTLVVTIALSLGFYYKTGINYLYIVYYSLAVGVVIGLTLLNRKYAFIVNGEPFYISVCIFSAFLLPQLNTSAFFLILSASLAVALLINVSLTDLKASFHLSIGLYFITLGLYVIQLASELIPSLLAQRISGTTYPIQLLLGMLLLFALVSYYHRIFKKVFDDYAFSYTQNKMYQNSVGLVYHCIVYFTGFLVVDYVFLLLIPDYRVNLIEWGLYTYSYLYFLLAAQNPKSRTKLWYAVILSALAVLIYTVVIHSETIYFRTLYITGISYALFPFLLHYLCLGILVLILLHVNKRLRMRYHENLFNRNILTFLGILLLCFILLSEYDHLVLVFIKRFSSQPAYELLQLNKFIPYSVILLSVSVFLLIFSLFHYTKFLRRLSILMILAVILKVLFVDIIILSANKSILLLFSLGAIFLALSLLIPTFRKQSHTTKPTRTEN